MKLRLFWKILLAFWVTIWLTAGGVILIFALNNQGKSNAQQFLDALRNERLEAAATAWDYGGRAALNRLTAAWPADARARLKVATDARGQARFSLTADRDPGFPFWPLAVWLVGSLLFSAALGSYLARPLGPLRDGFRRLSHGELGVRLAHRIGRRRDEIADLARDFDVMADRLQHLVAGRDRLLHDVSHELRSPLARLDLAVALARQDPALGQQTLARVEMESARLNALVGDLLSLSRAESGAETEDIYFDIATLLQMVCDDARFEAQPTGVKVELALTPDLAEPNQAPLMVGAPELLRRAMDNVIRNALRFSPPDKTVEVRARTLAGQVVIEVCDQGPGVPEALLKNMFDPFVKGTQGGGVGLGLAIAHRALAAHKGELQAFNRPGGGLLMRLSLPCSAQAVASGV